MRTIVISAVNLNVGGTLTILRDCLSYLSSLAASGDYRVVALVYKKELAEYPNIEYLEMQWPKSNWFNRLWCEYVTMKGISCHLSPVYLWLSLHDTTPAVKAERRVVYCHNSFPFYKWKVCELFFAPKVVLFALFSKYVYRTNIYENNYVVVQQQWLKDAFLKMFRLHESKIIVAPPTVPQLKAPSVVPQSITEYQFFFPAAPDSHKNFECICKATKMLEAELGNKKFRVYLTIKGDENRYTRWLHRTWGRDVASLHFVGYLDKSTLYEYYAQSHCLIFPSKVETWGLPITEFAAFGKPMLLSDLPYAHETVGGCAHVSFFNPDAPQELAEKMKRLIRGDKGFLTTVSPKKLTPPIAPSWCELFDSLLNDGSTTILNENSK